MKHDAFISYRHTEAQQRLARALERGLQRFAKPLFKARARAVFRDEANLNLSPHLWGSIESALDDSRFFLYMASPDSARSKWVGKEVEHWRSNRGLDHMILLLTDGDLVWDEAARDFDAAASTAIAPALHGAFEGEPFYLDLRWTREAQDLSLDNPAFKQAIVQIVATVEGKSVENMMGEEFEQHRRATRIRNLAIGALGLLAVLAGGAAIVASQQRAEAVARAREATLRLLSLQADQEWKDSKYGREGPAVAKFLYEHLPEDPLAQQVIFKVLDGRLGRSTPIHTGEWVPFAAFSGDGDAIVLGLASGEVRLLELGGAEIARFPSPHGAALSSATPVANGGVLAAYEDGAVILWSPAGPVHLESPGVRSVRGAAARDASRLVTWGDGAAVLRDALGNRIAAIELEEGEALRDAALSRDGARLGLLVAHSETCEIRLHDAKGERAATLSLDAADCEGQLQFSPLADAILLGETALRLIDFAGRELAVFRDEREDAMPWVDRAKFSADGRVLTTVSAQSGKGVIWEQNGERVQDLGHTFIVNDIDGNAKGQVVTGADDDLLKLWNADGVEVFAIQLLSHQGEGGVQQVVFSPDGDRVLAVYGTSPFVDAPRAEVEILSLDLSRVMNLREEGGKVSEELRKALLP